MKCSALILLSILISLTSSAQLSVTAYDVKKGQADSNPTNLIAIGDKLYFYAYDANDKYTLHSIDQQKNIKQETTITTHSYDPNQYDINGLNYILPKRIALIGNKLYFSGNDGTHGEELWELDAAGNAKMVVDINVNSKVPNTTRSSYPHNFTIHDNKLYFIASLKERDTTGVEDKIFEYNPSNNKLTNISDKVSPKINLYINTDLVLHNDRLYFFSNLGHLSTYDLQLKFSWGLNSNSIQNIYARKGITVKDNKIYFIAVASVNGKGGTYLVEYDGIRAPKTLTPAIRKRYYVYPEDLVSFRGQLYFTTEGNTNNLGLRDFVLGTYNHTNQSVNAITGTTAVGGVANGHVYNDMLFYNPLLGSNVLTVYDGTNQPTHVKELRRPRDFAIFNGELFFGALHPVDGIGIELYSLKGNTTSIPKNSTTTIGHTLYPNPVKDVAHLELPLKTASTLKVVLTNMEGRVVYESPERLYSASTHTIDVPLNNLPPANYVYNVVDNNGNVKAEGRLTKY